MTALCVDFGGTEIKLGLLDGGEILAATALPNTGREADLETVRVAALELAGRAAARIDGVGIALPGVVDRTRGSLVAAHDKYDWATGRDLRAWAAEAFGVPALVENDARAALLGETTYGRAAGATDAVLVTLGTGIGTAAMIDGVLLRGARDHAGILGGHITVDLDGPPCNCGNVGCAEAVASTWALQRDAAADPDLAAALAGDPAAGDRAYGDATGTAATGATAARPGLKELFEHAADPRVAPTVDRYLRAWAAAIVGLCHAYDPSVVIVSGGVMRSAEFVLPRLTTLVHEHLWSSSYRPPLVTPAAPEHSVLLGLSAAVSRKDTP
ncbi:ROK family protein [Leifsonia sp. NPDC058248]|uniref:ROK family protein n=1 Tax=Leifsonia sp. NPDC058248 TaxID=3346402 RepID=UPI0036D77CD4